MYVCKECEATFSVPKHYVEAHGLDAPPYEEYDGCPNCAGTYEYANICDNCGEYVLGEYAKTSNGYVFCDNCYTIENVKE